MYRFFIFSILILFFVGCGSKTPYISNTATILIKSPSMKFYDKGFITYYEDHIVLEVLSTGHSLLKLKIYDDEICKDSLRCMDADDFYKEFLNGEYKDDFLMQLLLKKGKVIQYKDKNILIKVIKD